MTHMYTFACINTLMQTSCKPNLHSVYFFQAAISHPNFFVSSLTMNINHSQLVAVVGQVGAGKSTLISSLLGETIIVSGQVSVNVSSLFYGHSQWIHDIPYML